MINISAESVTEAKPVPRNIVTQPAESVTKGEHIVTTHEHIVTRVTRVIGPKAVGRPRQYESAAERQKAYRERKKAKETGEGCREV